MLKLALDREPAPARRRDRSRRARRAAPPTPTSRASTPPGTATPPPLPPAAPHRVRRPAPAAHPRVRPAARGRARGGRRAPRRAASMTAEDAIRAEHQRQAAAQVSVATRSPACASARPSTGAQYVERGQPGRAGPAARSRRRLRPHGLPEPRPLPAGGRGAGRAERRGAGAGRAARGRERAPGRGERRRRRDRAAHVGYHLIGRGRARPRGRRRLPPAPAPARCGASSSRTRPRVYLGSIALVTALLRRRAASPTRARAARRLARAGRRGAARCCCRRATLAIALVQRLVARAGRRRAGCRASTSAAACPTDARTMVVVPTLLDERRAASTSWSSTSRCWRSATSTRTSTSRSSATSPTPPRATMPEDDGDPGRGARRHRGAQPRASATDARDRFYLFHRARQWNAARRARGWAGSASAARSRSSTGCCAAPPTPASRVQVGDLDDAARGALLHHARLRHAPAARRRASSSIGIIAHPLNRPRFDPRARPRHRGLRHPAAARQRDHGERRRARSSRASTPATPASTPTRPRSPTPTRTSSAKASSPARASTTSTRSSAALEGRVPENALLSHDLFEGLYARTALVTDVEVVDDYPVERARPRAAPAPLGARRLADPALAVPVGADARAACERNRLPLIARWKIFDNLRRSLVRAGDARAARCSAWTRPARAARWSGRRRRWPRSRSRCYPLLLDALARPARRSSRGASSCATCARTLETALAQASPAAHVPRLPGLARWLHAIGVTLVRLSSRSAGCSSGRRPRRSAARAAAPRGAARAFVARDGGEPADRARRRWRSWSRVRPARAARRRCPSSLLWARGARRRLRAEPAGAARRARARAPRTALPARAVARKTWRYFETLRRAPRTTGCRRTTSRSVPEPTRRASHLADQHRHGPARDARRARPRLHRHATSWSTRIDATLDDDRGARAHEGHLLNWYDTQTLAPLLPRYVSTVDSGNLAGALITLAEGLRQLRARTPRRRRCARWPTRAAPSPTA